MIYRLLRIALLFVLLSVLGIVIWMRMSGKRLEVRRGKDQGLFGLSVHLHKPPKQADDDEDGDEPAPPEFSEAVQAVSNVAAAKLMAMGVIVTRLSKDGPCVTANASMNLGDEGFQLLGKCKTLESLVLDKTDANDERVKYLADIPHLTCLAIPGSPKVTDEGFKLIANQPDLVSLNLRGTSITDKSLELIGQMSNLATLDLSSTHITDAGLKSLAGLNKLQWILLIDDAITDEGLANLPSLPQLHRLTLQDLRPGSKVRVTAAGKAAVRKKFPELRDLD